MQRRTEEVASLTDADVIELVNNTQLDAADQLLLPKAPRCTQRACTPSAIHPHHADLPAVPSASSEQRNRSVDAAAISHQPIIHHKRRHAIHTICTHGDILLVRPFFAASLTSQKKINSGINPWSPSRYRSHTITFLPTLRRSGCEINNY